MARPRKPDHLKLIQGTFRKSRRTPDHLQMPSIELVPPAPEWLPNAAAAQEWNRIVPLLIGFQLMPEISLSVVGHFCALHGRLVRLWSAGETPTAALQAQYRGFAAELGLTAISLQKFKPRSSEPADENPFASIHLGSPPK